MLLEGVGARDSTVFHFDDRWWLFCTVAGADPQSIHADLHIWHAPEPWGPWAPHALQPAKTDLRSSRPAGRPFTLDGVLYRPAQDGFPRYGARTVINRVLTLTPSEFAEEVCSVVEPDPLGPYGASLHTIASAGGLVVTDGCSDRPTLNPFKMAMAIFVKVRRTAVAARVPKTGHRAPGVPGAADAARPFARTTGSWQRGHGVVPGASTRDGTGRLQKPGAEPDLAVVPKVVEGPQVETRQSVAPADLVAGDGR